MTESDRIKNWSGVLPWNRKEHPQEEGRSLIWPTLFFALLTAMMTWPLPTRVNDSVIGWTGDNFYFVWLIKWFQKALFELHKLPLYVPFLNYPEGWHLAYNEMTPAMVVTALPASLIGGPVFGYNFALFLSFILSGLGVFLWVRRLTTSTTAGIVAGTIFAFAPYRTSHMLGHFNLMGTQWFAFFFMSLENLLQKGSRRSVVLTALFLGLIGLTSQYYLMMTLVISSLYVIGHFLFIDHGLAFRFDFWARLSATTVVALPLLALSLAPYAQLAFRGELSPRSFEEVRQWSASPTDFILPSAKHFIWGASIDQHFDRRLWIENTLYVGALTVGLAALAFVKREEVSNGKYVKLLMCVVFGAFVLALGTDLHWLEQSVTVGVPSLFQRWYPYQRTFVPLPGYFLFKFLPFYGGMRVWMRYGIFVVLFASVLAGLGAAWLLSRVNRRLTHLVTFLLLFLIVVDFYPGIQALSHVKGRAVDVWLASQKHWGAVVQFPLWQITQPEQTFYTLVHNKPFVGGFFAAFSPPQFKKTRPVLTSFPNQESVDLLRELGVQYVLVDANRFPDFPRRERAIETLGLRRLALIDDQVVYEMPVP